MRSGWLIVTLCVALQPSFSQSRLLDAFETTEGWKAIVSDGAQLMIEQGEGKTGKALAMQFDLSRVSGYVIAQKQFDLELPGNYQFTFDMKADAPVNNFEFKIIDDHQNVHWIKKLNVEYPKTWVHQRIKKRHLSFAWGPQKDLPLRRVRAVEFVVSVGTGGRGSVLIDNFRFAVIDDGAAAKTRATLRSSPPSTGSPVRIDPQGTMISAWTSSKSGPQRLTVDFGRTREVGGLVIDWDRRDFGRTYAIQLSDDAREWATVYAVDDGNGGKDYIPLPESEGRYLQLVVSRTSRNKGVRTRTILIKDPQFSATPNDFFRNIAGESPRGYYPKHMLGHQSYWTVLGVHGDSREALLNEEGQIEVDKLRFSLEPFLFVDSTLVTWSHVTATPTLQDEYLPFPSVTWNYRNEWMLQVEPVAAGNSGNSLLGVRYTLECRRPGLSMPRLFIAIRPFQVNPPWQFLNIEGGVARVDSIRYHEGCVVVDAKRLIPMTQPSGFGATVFASGDIVEYLARGILPGRQDIRDEQGWASAALAYDLSMREDDIREVHIAVPFHHWTGSPAPHMSPGSAETYYSLMRTSAVQWWKTKLNTVRFTVPPVASEVINTLRSNIAYIFINRDGPGIQPGSRSYERSWIRDGSLTATALLQMGHQQEVREFIDWYARGQFPSGKIPCVIDARGPDTVPEHDSHGQFIYAVMQYFRYMQDTSWLRDKFEAVRRTVRYIQALRAERKTDAYRTGPSAQRALYGLVPESISHEGYSDVPRHSYWDGFFVLRGLKDAVSIAAVLGEETDAAAWSAERDDFQKDLYASMRLAMQNTGIDYIPGCAELGDFDATSTTIGIIPGGELGSIPEPPLHNTFDRYFSYFQERKVRAISPNYTPYETRLIGTFVHLGQRERAEEALAFFMQDRRPLAWNHWAEVVWRDPATPKFIGDMPHTWVGSDFIRSVRTMFAYERERDTALVIGAGIPQSWIASSTGVGVTGLPTWYGALMYSMRQEGSTLTVQVGAGIRLPAGGIVVSIPVAEPPQQVSVNGLSLRAGSSGETRIHTLPSTIVVQY